MIAIAPTYVISASCAGHTVSRVHQNTRVGQKANGQVSRFNGSVIARNLDDRTVVGLPRDMTTFAWEREIFDACTKAMSGPSKPCPLIGSRGEDYCLFGYVVHLGVRRPGFCATVYISISESLADAADRHACPCERTDRSLVLRYAFSVRWHGALQMVAYYRLRSDGFVARSNGIRIWDAQRRGKLFVHRASSGFIGDTTDRD